MDQMKIYGYMLSNGLIALCGALLTQNNGYADLNSWDRYHRHWPGFCHHCRSDSAQPHHRLAPGISRSWLHPLPHDYLGYLEIPGMDADLVKLFSAILLAVVLFVPEVQVKNPSFSWYGQNSLGGQYDNYLSIQSIHKTLKREPSMKTMSCVAWTWMCRKGIYSIIGGNGAGKSTLMNSLAGTLTVDQGDILLEGKIHQERSSSQAS